MRRGRPLKALIVLGVLVAVAGGALFAFWPQIFALYDEELIWSRKASHWHSYADGKLPLPGTPDLASLDKRLSAAGVSRGAPVLLRIFKREFELEVWMQARRPLRALRHLSDLHVVGRARPEGTAGG